MAKAICQRTCYTPIGIFYRGLKSPDQKPMVYEINPVDSWAIHFDFEDPDAQRIRNTNELKQRKVAIEHELRGVKKSLAQQKLELEADLAQIDQALHDTPNAVKAQLNDPK